MNELPPLPWADALANREAFRARGPFLLVTTAQPSLETHTLGGEIHPSLGRLIQPRHVASIERTSDMGVPWAADNDCFQKLDAHAYFRMLDRLQPIAHTCLFVAVPDVVGDACATAIQFELWAEACKRRGLPAALVAQDGIEEMPRWLNSTWHRIDALFMGGTTEWKESLAAILLADEARRRGKWVHWGRVNTKRRFDLLVARHGDSFDGSKFARWRKTHLDTGLLWCHIEAHHRFADAVASIGEPADAGRASNH